MPKKKRHRCALCGRFRLAKHLVQMQAEGESTWLECKDCMSKADYNNYFKAGF